MSKILVLCTGNSCRSQMAEGFLKSFDDKLEVYSAGVHPAERVSPKAIEVMKESGIDISDRSPKDVSRYIDDSFDYVITVCDKAKESCPIFLGEVKNSLHINFEDPSEAEGTEEELLSIFRIVRDEIENEFKEFYHRITSSDI